MRTQTAPWPATQAPGIATHIPHATLILMKEALRAVDIDIERTGTVSVETVEKVRHARQELRK